VSAFQLSISARKSSNLFLNKLTEGASTTCEGIMCQFPMTHTVQVHRAHSVHFGVLVRPLSKIFSVPVVNNPDVKQQRPVSVSWMPFMSMCGYTVIMYFTGCIHMVYLICLLLAHSNVHSTRKMQRYGSK